MFDSDINFIFLIKFESDLIFIFLVFRIFLSIVFLSSMITSVFLYLKVSWIGSISSSIFPSKRLKSSNILSSVSTFSVSLSFHSYSDSELSSNPVSISSLNSKSWKIHPVKLRFLHKRKKNRKHYFPNLPLK
ncbi:unnamed protein product [Blepharisma stoltei]|uniref:Uncharacterized protein n=1 Tax=Blepharisma stoltei TaxID=1481888 RepID=A0AAU9JWL0_9CILI|nr:unnamed protein product [Blepharisma stoltei]